MKEFIHTETSSERALLVGLVTPTQNETKTMEYLDELEKSSASADNMRSQIQNYLDDAASAKVEAEEAKREIARLRRELDQLKGKASGGTTSD